MQSVGPMDFKSLEWLVDRRSKIQRLSLALLKSFRDKQIPSCNDDLSKAVAGLLVGRAFSLWRAVFLPHESQHWDDKLNDAGRYLQKIIADNVITYSDDKSMRGWVFGYYTNNVRFRIYHICQILPELNERIRAAGLWKYIDLQKVIVSHHEATDLWGRYYMALEVVVSCLSARMPNH